MLPWSSKKRTGLGPPPVTVAHPQYARKYSKTMGLCQELWSPEQKVTIFHPPAGARSSPVIPHSNRLARVQADREQIHATQVR